MGKKALGGDQSISYSEAARAAGARTRAWFGPRGVVLLAMWQCLASTWWRWAIAVGLLSVYLAACGPITRGPPAAAPTPETAGQTQGPLARIGAALSLTGPASR